MRERFSNSGNKQFYILDALARLNYFCYVINLCNLEVLKEVKLFLFVKEVQLNKTSLTSAKAEAFIFLLCCALHGDRSLKCS